VKRFKLRSVRAREPVELLDGELMLGVTVNENGSWLWIACPVPPPGRRIGDFVGHVTLSDNSVTGMRSEEPIARFATEGRPSMWDWNRMWNVWMLAGLVLFAACGIAIALKLAGVT